MSTPDTRDAALVWHDAGVCVIQARSDGSKAPLGEWNPGEGKTTWKQWTVDRPARATVQSWFDAGHPALGIVCGAVSGDLEMFELEGRAVAEGVAKAFLAALDDHGLSELKNRLLSGYVEQSPSGGWHFIYRVAGTVTGNTKLAQREARDEELTDEERDLLARKGKRALRCLIETRGEGGFVVIAPSNGTTHPSGKPWRAAEHSTPGVIATITETERDYLHAVATLFDTVPRPEPRQARTRPAGEAEGDRPGDDFNARATWEEILEPNGWSRLDWSDNGQRVYWTRPGKARGVSAVTGGERDLFWCWSTSTELDAETSYSKFALYAALEHGGDYSAAARELRRRGYGTPASDGTTFTATPLGTPRPDAEEELWSMPELAALRTFARARRTSPWAVLGVTLVRVVTAVPPYVVLPPLTGGEVSLNLFAALVGPSGSGKDAATEAATEALDVGHLETCTPGSGEGIAHAYMVKTKNGAEMHTSNVLFTVPEIDTLAALAARKGATLMPELRRAWMGSRLGFQYADAAKRLPVPAHRYRMGLIAGVQPTRAGALLDDADGGTPQRWLWLPTVDPDAPDTPPEAPAPQTWQRPTWSGPGRLRIDVCDTARAAIDTTRLATLRGDGGDPLDGHRALARLKTAAALALLCGRTDVTDADWHRAGIILARSDATRAAVVERQVAQAQEATTRRAEAQATAAVITEERLGEAAVKRVARAIRRKLTGRDWTARHEVRKILASRDRDWCEEALDRLLAAGSIERRETTHGEQYRATEEAA